MTNWEKLKHLSSFQLGVLVSALFLLPAINLLLRVLGYVRLLRLIEKLTPIRQGQPMPADSMAQAKSVAHMVAIAANRGIYHGTCLRRSLLVLYFLRRLGVPGVIQFGVRLVDGTLEAHAWVEWQGVIINDEADVRERFSLLENGIPNTQAGL